MLWPGHDRWSVGCGKASAHNGRQHLRQHPRPPTCIRPATIAMYSFTERVRVKSTCWWVCRSIHLLVVYRSWSDGMRQVEPAALVDQSSQQTAVLPALPQTLAVPRLVACWGLVFPSPKVHAPTSLGWSARSRVGGVGVANRLLLPSGPWCRIITDSPMPQSNWPMAFTSPVLTR